MYPHERSLVTNFKDRPFALLGVNSDKDLDALKVRMEKENITWRSWRNDGSTSGPISTQWNVSGWPTTYLIDHMGVIRFKDLRGEPLEEAIELLVAEAEAAEAACTLDLSNPGKMKDIVSNALNRSFDFPSEDVVEFLNDAETRYANGQAIIAAAATRFDLSEEQLTREVERFRHCNCPHASGSPAWPTGQLTKFASDVTIHVVLHELAHALIREFDLPVLANEEAAADAFATHFLTTHLPDIAFDVLSARTTSLMIEAREVPREEWRVDGEHNNDARRAFQIAALAIAADPEKYGPIAVAIGMPADAQKKSKDYGTEIHRSWRRLLKPLWLPESATSRETRLRIDENIPLLIQLSPNGVPQLLFAALQRFDWHSQVTLHFADGQGRAGWNRSKRTITVYTEYIDRFIKQGQQAARTSECAETPDPPGK